MIDIICHKKEDVIRFASQIKFKMAGIIMNKLNVVGVLGLVLAVGAVTYAALSPVAMAVRQDPGAKAFDVSSGQYGYDGTRGSNGLSGPDSRGSNGGNGADGRGFSIQLEVN